METNLYNLLKKPTLFGVFLQNNLSYEMHIS